MRATFYTLILFLLSPLCLGKDFVYFKGDTRKNLEIINGMAHIRKSSYILELTRLKKSKFFKKVPVETILDLKYFDFEEGEKLKEMSLYFIRLLQKWDINKVGNLDIRVLEKKMKSVKWLYNFNGLFYDKTKTRTSAICLPKEKIIIINHDRIMKEAHPTDFVGIFTHEALRCSGYSKLEEDYKLLSLIMMKIQMEGLSSVRKYHQMTNKIPEDQDIQAMAYYKSVEDEVINTFENYSQELTKYVYRKGSKNRFLAGTSGVGEGGDWNCSSFKSGLLTNSWIYVFLQKEGKDLPKVSYRRLFGEIFNSKCSVVNGKKRKNSESTAQKVPFKIKNGLIHFEFTHSRDSITRNLNLLKNTLFDVAKEISKR